MHATTILGVRRDGEVALAGDGQVTLGDVVLKHGARKIRTLDDGQVLAGFAGAVADALTLFEKFEAQLKAWDGNLRRASVELAKEWRTDRYLRRLEAQLHRRRPRVAAGALWRRRRDRAGRRHRRRSAPARRTPPPPPRRCSTYTELAAPRDRRGGHDRSPPTSASSPTTTSRSSGCTRRRRGWTSTRTIEETPTRSRRPRAGDETTRRGARNERRRHALPATTSTDCRARATRHRRAATPQAAAVGEPDAAARSWPSSTATSSGRPTPSGRSRSPCATATGGSCCRRRCGEEIQPKNILMIGPTGVGKTEIARRVAQDRRCPVHQGRGDQVHRGRLRRPRRRVDRPRSGRGRDRTCSTASGWSRSRTRRRSSRSQRLAECWPSSCSRSKPATNGRKAAVERTDEHGATPQRRSRRRSGGCSGSGSDCLRLLNEQRAGGGDGRDRDRRRRATTTTATASSASCRPTTCTTRFRISSTARCRGGRRAAGFGPRGAADPDPAGGEPAGRFRCGHRRGDPPGRGGGGRLPRRDRQDDPVESASTAATSPAKACSAICCRSSKARSS